MAVKQNTTDDNNATVTAKVNTVPPNSSGNKSNASVGDGAAKKKNLSHDGGGSNGESNHTESVKSTTCSGGFIKSTSVGQQVNNGEKPGNINELQHILKFIEVFEEQDFDSIPYVVVYERIIYDLARIESRKSVEHLKRFKEDIAKVGAFLAKPNDKNVYFYYLRLVCKLITNSKQDVPCCGVAIVFQLFSPELILQAVQSLLSYNIPDTSIRKTVSLLCDWVRHTHICQNLNLWIMTLLTGLQEQGKHILINEIAMDNIDRIFRLLILPALRNKVAPIIFYMLTTIVTPDVFHKILPRIVPVIRILKQQTTSMDESVEDAKNCMQKLVDISHALMVRFYGYDALYASLVLALKEYKPSYNYLSLVNNIGNNDDHLNSLLENNTNPRVGLVNLGNTCYLNSVLQALAMTKEFSRQIMLIETKAPIVLKMQQQIALMHYSTRYELTPTRVLNATRPPGFVPGLQQDSSEFLGHLLDTLHENELAFQPKYQQHYHQQQYQLQNKENHGEGSQQTEGATSMLIDSAIETGVIPYNSSHNTICASNNFTQPPVATFSSTIEKTFNGKLSTIFKCLNCGSESHHYDNFRELQLSFPENNDDCNVSNYSVQDLLDYYCSPEKLDGDNQYYCDNCKDLSDAERFINVINAPKNLILTLKHFKYDQKFNMRAKLMHKVFHDEKVTLKVCSTKAPDEIVHYDLYAGVVHSGFSMDSGHYYTYAADESNKWFKFNDNIVTLTETDELHNLTPPNTPYILFYQMSARSNEITEAAASASAKVVKIDIPVPLTLQQLPRQLRDYVNYDNGLFNEELRMKRYKQQQASKQNNILYNNNSNNDRYNNDDDDDQTSPPSSNGCGGNVMDMNVNRFVY